MMRFAGALAISILAVGCGVGNPDDGGMQMNPLGRQCTAVFTTHGTFAPDATNPKPVDVNGCWPIGVWNFSVSIASNDCSPAPELASQYQFKGTATLNMDGDPVQSFEYMTDPSARNIVKVSEGGTGLCEGELQLFSADGLKVWLFKPELNADNSITGDGEFGVFTTNQWPF
jgi:hypothetical protein